MKIDAFCHVMPEEYFKRLFELPETEHSVNLRTRVAKIPALRDMDVRFRQMDEFGDYRQIINITAPPLEDIGSPDISRQMARIGNEALAGMVQQHPGRFAGFCAAVSLDDPEAAVAEYLYARRELGALGAQIYTHVHGAPMDRPELDVFYQAVAADGGLLQVHPSRSSLWADYPTEPRSRFELWWTFGWEMDLSLFMARMVFSGVLERFPALRLLIHHGGSMVPHFSGRVGPGLDQMGARTPASQRDDVAVYPLSRPHLDYFKMMYGDTAMFGAAHALRCCIEFFGASHILFASDSPYDPEKGPGYIRATIANLMELDLPDEDRQAIFSGNVSKLLGLPAS